MRRQIMQARCMKTDIAITVEDRVWRERLVADRNTPAKVVWRARIVLAAAEGESVKAIARTTASRSRACDAGRGALPTKASTASCATRPGRRAASRWLPI
jgi:hypothetical protein